mmetsp:Transcript_36758/g.91848  ORF Transcript_36758/g.91848 Transcript_36758/m.91848 type:complete len:220 (+) Transcript_36758:153-812(+)
MSQHQGVRTPHARGRGMRVAESLRVRASPPAPTLETPTQARPARARALLCHTARVAQITSKTKSTQREPRVECGAPGARGRARAFIDPAALRVPHHIARSTSSGRHSSSNRLAAASLRCASSSTASRAAAAAAVLAAASLFSLSCCSASTAASCLNLSSSIDRSSAATVQHSARKMFCGSEIHRSTRARHSLCCVRRSSEAACSPLCAESAAFTSATCT